MKKETKEEEVFSTRDLFLATTLITLKFYMVNIDYQIEGDKPVGYFNFELSEELEKAEKDYWQGRLLVEPRAWTTNFRGLKAQVYNIYKGPKSPISQKLEKN